MDRRSRVIAASSAVIFGVAHLMESEGRRKKRKRSVWCKTWIGRRYQGLGVLDMVQNELRIEDRDSFTNYLRMSPVLFDELLAMVQDDIKKEDTMMRMSISASQKLALTLRFLATGESFKSLMYSSRIHFSTISLFIPVVCKAICSRLKDSFLKFPQTVEDWSIIARDFLALWNYPHCLGAIDGKHISFRPPRSAGSHFYNYKRTHSIVLLGVANAHNEFIYADVGVNGRISDGGVFRRCSLWKALAQNRIVFPPPQPLPNSVINCPFHFIGDDAFPLSERLMKPYPCKQLTNEKLVFNRRLSRARGLIETSFGILSNRFRVLLSPINLSADKVELITLTCVVLHNYLIQKNRPEYVRSSSDCVDGNASSLPDLTAGIGHNPPAAAKRMRERLTKYFNTIDVL